MKRKIFTILLSFVSIILFADDVVFSASAPQQVIVGKPFQIVYSVNQRSKDLRQPEMEGFDVLAGPYSSSSSSTSWINGKRTSTYQQTYTYTVVASKEGTYTLQPATVMVDGSKYSSNGLKIKVLPADETESGSQSTSAAQGSVNNSASGQQTSNDDIFIRTLLSKQKVYEQECVLLQYKLYFAGVDVTQFTNNTRLPEFKGFLKQELEQGDIQTQLEHYNGRNYYTAVLYQTLLYPQHSGEIKIDPAQFEAVLRVQTRSQVRSIFDDFFGSYTNVTRNLTAPGVKVNVSSLPKGKPAGFSGGVGHFNMTSEISSTNITQNDAVTLKITLSGSGNIKLLKTPSVDFPEGFEEYDPKVSNNFKTTTSGMSGTKTIEYLFIPRAAGDYTIPSVDFSYFDTQTGEYKTLSTPEYNLHINRGAADETATVVSTYVNKEDIKQLGTDIRYIYTGNLKTQAAKKLDMSFGSRMFWLIYVILLLLLTSVSVFIPRLKRRNADVVGMKYRKANKVAQKRLKEAKKMLSQNLQSKFYEEIERVAWQYLSDRLSVPTSKLNKENIAQLLAQKNVPANVIDDVKQVLETAQFARYAPSANSQMQDLYDKTANMIDQLENQKL